MTGETPPIRYPRVAVGVVCLKTAASGQVEALLIRRGRPPRKGQWSVPGGKAEWGESIMDTARRELLEETGIKADIGPLLGVYEIIEPDYHYVLVDYLAHWRSGEPRAADDADDAAFFSRAAALEAVVQPDLKDVLTRAFEHPLQVGF